MSQNEKNQNVRVRFAPSPSGFFHIGSARTALFNELFARGCGGTLVLRIEDTNRDERASEYEASILRGLEWLGVSYDEFARQSERTAIYKKYLEDLIDNGWAYISKEEQGERSEVIRLKNPGESVTFSDAVRGQVTMDTSELGDFVIAKDKETPLYHLAVAVDDFEMGITHIIRGEDGISNTPRQMLIQKALGAPQPKYAHIPLILAPDKSKLSKRHGAVAMEEYRDLGYLPEAMTNFLALLGWNPGTDQEIFSKDELVEAFDLERVQKGGAVFGKEKLDWFNRKHLEKKPAEELHPAIAARLSEFYDPEKVKTLVPKLTPILLERIATLGDVRQMAEAGDLDYFFEAPDYEAGALVNPKSRASEHSPVSEHSQVLERTQKHLETIIEMLNEHFEPEQGIGAEALKEVLWPYATEEGRGDVLWPMRFALSGREKSPDPFVLVEILGLRETQSRLRNASQKLTGAV